MIYGLNLYKHYVTHRFGLSILDKKKPAKVVHDASGKNEDHENFEKSLLQVCISKKSNCLHLFLIRLTSQVALIDEIETHPASDKLFVCKVEYEPGKVCQVNKFLTLYSLWCVKISFFPLSW